MMTRRYTHLIAVAILIAAFSASFAERSETVDELRARAEQGDADAQIKLGVRYYYGRGVPEDDAEAERWLRLAAEDREREPVDELRAKAEQGDAAAQYNLGTQYADGRGVPQDLVEAAHMIQVGGRLLF